jgi:CDP-glycerol glycerophosphotransferase
MAQQSAVSLSVVVPFFDSADRLPICLDSLLAQTHPELQVVLVDDGSDDGSREIARRYVHEHPGVCLVEQGHQGVAAARDAGVERASGAYLAFCDADDEVPPAAYARLVGALHRSGSDLAVASVAIQDRGIYSEPAWARSSNERRRLGVGLEDVPQIMANVMPGTRVFRRSSWDRAGCSFAAAGDRGDIVPMVRALLAARSFDVLPAVGYRWAWRSDGRSLLQRDLVDREQARERVASMRAASELLVDRGPELARQHFLAQVLHAAADLVRAAAYQDEDYWQMLSRELGLLIAHAAPERLQHVPVMDRVTTWLCAHDDRGATEKFLEYAADNGDSFPYAVAGGRASITTPVRESLPTDVDLTRVADADRRFRTRLTELGWETPGVLRLEGAALVEYTSGADRHLNLVLRERGSGKEVSLPTRALVSHDVNRWAARAYEDHSAAGFAARVDLASLVGDGAGRTTFDVQIRLEVDGLIRVGPFQSRRSGGSPGLLEISARDGLAGVPDWSEHQGLSLTVRPARDGDRASPLKTAPVVVNTITAAGDVLSLTGSSAADVELALVGPRSRTPWAPTTRTDAGFAAQLPVLVDEWGLGPATLPGDQYAVMARLTDGSESRVGLSRALWRKLPPFVDSGRHAFHPSAVGGAGSLVLRIAPGADRDSRSPYLHVTSRYFRLLCSRPSRAGPVGTTQDGSAKSWRDAGPGSTWSSAWSTGLSWFRRARDPWCAGPGSGSNCSADPATSSRTRCCRGSSPPVPARSWCRRGTAAHSSGSATTGATSTSPTGGTDGSCSSPGTPGTCCSARARSVPRRCAPLSTTTVRCSRSAIRATTSWWLLVPMRYDAARARNSLSPTTPG